MIYIHEVINIERQKRADFLVEIDTGEIFNVTTEVMKQGDLVFVLPAGSVLPNYLANLTKLKRVAAEIPGGFLLHEDALVGVKTLYPVEPKKPGTKERISFVMGASGNNGVEYADLLGVTFVESTPGESDDPFALDDEDLPPFGGETAEEDRFPVNEHGDPVFESEEEE